MAINKNFVIKNGIEVKTNLLITDSDNTRVGINTASPDYTLHVNGGIGGTTAYLSGVSTFVGLSSFPGGINVGSGGVEIASSGDLTVGNVDVTGIITASTVNVSSGATFQGEVSVADKIIHLGDVNTAIRFPSADTFTVETAGSERVRVTSTGLVGIQTGTVRYGLDVVGTAGIDSDLIVGGASTFTGAVDANGGATIDNVRIGVAGDNEIDTSTGNLTLDSAGGTVTVDDDLSVTGVSTFTDTTDNTLGNVNTGGVQLDGGLGVAGNVTVGGGISVTGNSWFTGIVTFAAGTNGTIQLGDAATDNVVFNADVDSNFIPDDDNTYDLGSSSQQWKNLYLNGLAELDDVNVSAASTFGGLVDINLGANVSGGSGLVVSANGLQVTGVSTFANALDVNAELDVDGQTDLDTLQVAGVSTFSAAIDLNAELDVDGQTDLDNLVVAGVTTTGGLLDINAGGQANTFKVEDLTDNRVVIAGTGGELEDDANLTFNGSTLAVGVNLDVTGDLDVDGQTDLDNLVVTGVSTFSASIDLDGELDVDGQTDLDNLVVAGVSTLTTLKIGTTVGITSIVDEDTMVSDSATALPTQQSVKAYVDSQVTAQDLDFIADSGGALSIDLDSETLTVAGTANQVHTTGVGNTITVGLTTDVTISDSLTVTNDVIVSGGATITKALKVGTGGTTLTVDPDNSTFAIGSNSENVTATLNGGSIPSIGLVIALGS